VCMTYSIATRRFHRHGPRRKYNSSVAVYGAVPKDGCCMVVCFEVVF
jgi:hypothetical protein